MIGCAAAAAAVQHDPALRRAVFDRQIVCVNAGRQRADPFDVGFLILFGGFRNEVAFEVAVFNVQLVCTPSGIAADQAADIELIYRLRHAQHIAGDIAVGDLDRSLAVAGVAHQTTEIDVISRISRRHVEIAGDAAVRDGQVFAIDVAHQTAEVGIARGAAHILTEPLSGDLAICHGQRPGGSGLAYDAGKVIFIDIVCPRKVAVGNDDIFKCFVRQTADSAVFGIRGQVHPHAGDLGGSVAVFCTVDLIHAALHHIIGIDLAADGAVLHRAAAIQVFHQAAEFAVDIESARHVAVGGRAVSVGVPCKPKERGIHPGAERNAAICHHILLVFCTVRSKLGANAIRCATRIEIAADGAAANRHAALRLIDNTCELIASKKTTADSTVFDHRRIVCIIGHTTEVPVSIHHGIFNLTVFDAVSTRIVISWIVDNTCGIAVRINYQLAGYKNIVIVRKIGITSCCAETWINIGITRAIVNHRRINRNRIKSHILDKAPLVRCTGNVPEQAEIPLRLAQCSIGDGQTCDFVPLTVERAGEILGRRPELAAQVDIIRQRDRRSNKRTCVHLLRHPRKAGRRADAQGVARHIIAVVRACGGRDVFPFVRDQTNVGRQFGELFRTGFFQGFRHSIAEGFHLRFESFRLRSLGRNGCHSVFGQVLRCRRFAFRCERRRRQQTDHHGSA